MMTGGTFGQKMSKSMSKPKAKSTNLSLVQDPQVQDEDKVEDRLGWEQQHGIEP